MWGIIKKKKKTSYSNNSEVTHLIAVYLCVYCKSNMFFVMNKCPENDPFFVIRDRQCLKMNEIYVWKCGMKTAALPTDV